MLAMAIGIYTTLFSVCVHIHCCGYGHLGFRPYGGSLWKRAGVPAQPKVTKGLLPHHSAPRLGSVCLRSKSQAKRGGLTADLIIEACADSCGSWLACDGGVSVDKCIG